MRFNLEKVSSDRLFVVWHHFEDLFIGFKKKCGFIEFGQLKPVQKQDFDFGLQGLAGGDKLPT